MVPGPMRFWLSKFLSVFLACRQRSDIIDKSLDYFEHTAGSHRSLIVAQFHESIRMEGLTHVKLSCV